MTKKKQQFKYLSPSEVKQDRVFVNMQIALALKTCNTIQDVTELLDDIRLHERLIINGIIKPLSDGD